MKKAFTLIELLAVIITLAVIALIATPVVLKVVESAKESARKSSVIGYADTVRLAIVEKQFETGISPNINEDFLNDLSYQGEKVSCGEVINANKYGVVLHECNVGTDTKKYCFVTGKVYDCNDDEYKAIYDEARNNSGNENPDGEKPNVANAPELYDKMIPAIYNVTTNKWQYANINEKWYDYDLKEWANAIVLLPGKTYNIGQDIEMADIAMMYVWIPRYKYVIFNQNNDVAEKTISVIFENGTETTGTVRCFDAINQTDSKGNVISEICSDTINTEIKNDISTYTHPAFTFGDKELTGIWIGKFTMSTDNSTCTACNTSNSCRTACNKSTLNVMMKPGMKVWNFISAFNIFQSISSIKTTYGMSSVDTHMIKNMEWGAALYLKQSEYGLGSTIISGNLYSYYYSGGGITYYYSGYGKNMSETYNTVGGVKASTTGNVYGIYDMASNAKEIVMANVVDNNGNFTIHNSGFSTAPLAKYYDKYSYNSSNFVQSSSRLGDGMKEIIINTSGTNKGWYNNTPISHTVSWLDRGQSNSEFAFANFSQGGYSSNGISSRAVIVSN